MVGCGCCSEGAGAPCVAVGNDLPRGPTRVEIMYTFTEINWKSELEIRNQIEIRNLILY